MLIGSYNKQKQKITRMSVEQSTQSLGANARASASCLDDDFGPGGPSSRP